MQLRRAVDKSSSSWGHADETRDDSPGSAPADGHAFVPGTSLFSFCEMSDRAQSSATYELLEDAVVERLLDLPAPRELVVAVLQAGPVRLPLLAARLPELAETAA